MAIPAKKAAPAASKTAPKPAVKSPIKPAVKADTKPKAEKAERVKKPGVGEFVKAQILAGKDNDKILEMAKAKFPDAKTTNASINWYRSNLRKAGESVPSSRKPKEAKPAAAKPTKPIITAKSKAAAANSLAAKKIAAKKSEDSNDGGFGDDDGED